MDEYKKFMEEWKERMKEWRDKAKEASIEGMVLPHMPPMPPLISISVPRSNVVASRIGDEELRVIDMLVEAGLFTTRSEAVAYLVSEGIKARKDLLDKVSSALDEIRRIRREAEEYTAKLKREAGFVEPKALGEEAQQKRTCPKCKKDLTNTPEDITICPYCGQRLKS